MKKTAVLILSLLLMILSIPAYAEGIEVSSKAGDEISLFNGITVDSPVKGNVICVLGDVDVKSEVGGQVISVFGDVTVESAVSGQVVTIFGNTKVLKTGVLKNNLVALGSITKENGASILGDEVRIFGEYMDIDIQAILYLRLAIMLLFALTVLVIGLLVLVLSRKKYEEMVKSIEQNPGQKLLLGFLAFVGITILMVLLSITLIAPVIYIIILIAAMIPSCIYVGRFILRALNPKNSIIIEFVTGLITVTLVKFLLLYLLPQEGILLSLILMSAFGVIVNSMGLGVLTEARFAKK